MDDPIRVDRRALLRAGGAVAAGVALAGCGDQGEEEDVPASEGAAEDENDTDGEQEDTEAEQAGDDGNEGGNTSDEPTDQEDQGGDLEGNDSDDVTEE